MKTVADYMTRKLVSIDADQSVLEAIKLMKEKSVSTLLIMRESITVGIFTERDLLKRVDFSNLELLPKLKIKELMTSDLKMADINDSYVQIMESMQKSRIRHMPVVEDGFVRGMLSLRDLLEHYYENMEHLLEQTVAALSSAVEKRDPYTAGHQERVTQLACAIARELKLPEKQISGLRMAAFIHDIGKLNIPSEILSKSGKLTEVELSFIRIHPQAGYDIMQGIHFPWPVADIVLQHHEKLNGSGYPRGLLEGQILIEAKIIAVADVVEAMASHRPYRPSRGIRMALQEINENRNVLFDGFVVDACLTILKRDKLFWKIPEQLSGE